MKFTPIFLRNFEEELEELLDFINEKYSKRYVEQFLFQIEKCVDSLMQFPYLGVKYEDYTTNEYRKLNFKDFSIYYRVVEEQKKIYFVKIITSKIKSKKIILN